MREQRILRRARGREARRDLIEGGWELCVRRGRLGGTKAFVYTVTLMGAARSSDLRCVGEKLARLLGGVLI